MKTTNFSDVKEPQVTKQEPVWYKAGRIMVLGFIVLIAIAALKFCS